MEVSRLSPDIARSFLAKFGEHIETNVNIMDRDGVIVASRDPSRLGTYHAAAHRLIEARGTIEIAAPLGNLPPGVRPGVNLPLLVRGQTVGVVGVTGDPGAVMDLAYAVKAGVEAMAELELVKDGLLRKQSRRALLVHRLIQEEGGLPAADSLASGLGYNVHLVRAPLLVVPKAEIDPEDLWRLLKKRELRTPQDIGGPGATGELLLFKTIAASGEGIVAAYEKQVAALAAALAGLCSAPADGPGAACRVYAGMFQRDLSRYHLGYRQALWLRSRYGSGDGTQAVLISRHVAEYVTGLSPRSELVGLFELVEEVLAAAHGADLLETLTAVGARDFRLQEAAAVLGIHRNTLAARLDRIAELTGLDPRAEDDSRDLFRFLARYRQNTVHDAQYFFPY